MMIHRAFKAPKFVERVLIYVGTLVGMSGPFGIVKIHDVRDWAQRQQRCHAYFSHTEPFLRDMWWQLACRFDFSDEPLIAIENHYSQDTFYKFLEKTWRWHQVAVAVLLYIWGGWGFVIWGVCARVSLSVIGHWTITYICHNPGPGVWRVREAYVQASNIPGFGIVTYGECWHNNHHAFPESAKIGIEKGQCDPSWRFIQLLQIFGLITDVRLPRPVDQREDLYKTHR